MQFDRGWSFSAVGTGLMVRVRYENVMRAQAFVLVLLLIVVPCIAERVSANDALDSHSLRPCGGGDGRMDATYEVRYGQDVVWQVPPNPVAVLFMAHGGQKEPLSFFDRGLKCANCYGLPEDRTVVTEALRRRYAVIVVKSVGEAFVSWPIEESGDLVIVTDILKDWRAEHSLENLPLFAWGHSAGGSFVISMTLKLDIRALVVMCCRGLPEVVQNASPDWFPPTFFAYMPRDSSTAEDLVEEKSTLTDRGVRIEERECWPKPLSPSFFSERIALVNNETSAKIYAAYIAEGWVDSGNYLIEDPAVTDDWEVVLSKWEALPFCQERGHICLNRHVLQELNMAFAFHSLTSDADEEIYAFLDSTLSADNASKSGSF